MYITTHFFNFSIVDSYIAKVIYWITFISSLKCPSCSTIVLRATWVWVLARGPFPIPPPLSLPLHFLSTFCPINIKINLLFFIYIYIYSIKLLRELLIKPLRGIGTSKQYKSTKWLAEVEVGENNLGFKASSWIMCDNSFNIRKSGLCLPTVLCTFYLHNLILGVAQEPGVVKWFGNVSPTAALA